MERQADLVFKGRVLSSDPVTNASFPPWGRPHATRIEVISFLKGNVDTNIILFQHNTHGPNAWGGGTPPCHHVLLPGECYLIFAEKTETPGVFRQLSAMQHDEDDGVMRTLDPRPIVGESIKEAHWHELNRLLQMPFLLIHFMLFNS